MVEYLVILAFSVILLTRPFSAREIDPNASATDMRGSVIEQLANAIKDYHKNYSFAMSIAYIPNCTYAFSFDQSRPSNGIFSVTALVTGTIDRCVDMTNPHIPIPDITGATFQLDFVNSIADAIKDQFVNYVKGALTDFLDPAGLLDDIVSFDIGKFQFLLAERYDGSIAQNI